MENIILGFVLGASIVGFIALLMIVIRLSFIITEMATIVKSTYISVNKIEQMSYATMQASENFVDALSEATKEDPTSTGNLHFIKMFGSADGKHVSPTVDGLIEKMKKDPSYQQLSEQDIEEIKKIFEDNANDDDEDEPNEPWK